MSLISSRRRVASVVLASASVLALGATPVPVFAATVTLTNDTTVVLPSDSSTYTLSSGGTFDNLSISGSTLTFTMSPGESVTLTGSASSANQAFDNDGGFSYTCGSPSVLTLSATSNITVNVNPQASNTCGGGNNGGGNNGGGSSASPSSSIQSTTAPAMVTITPTISTTTVTAPVHGSSLSQSQMQSVLGLLESFNADSSVIQKVQLLLEGMTGIMMKSVVFSRDLHIGMNGSDVLALQQYLNSHGYTVAVSGPGSPGSETIVFGKLTKVALAKFQKAVGITPAFGYFGPKTKAYIEAN